MASPVVGTTNEGQGGGVAFLTVTLTNAPGADDLIAVLATVYTGTGGGAWTLTSSGGSGVTITERINGAGTSDTATGTFIYTVTFSTAPTSLTLTRASGSGCYISMVCVNVSGQNASYIDVVGTQATGTSTAPVASSMGALTDATDLVLGVMTHVESGAYTVSPGTNWTQITEIDETNTSYITLNAIQRTPGATGTYNPTWTMTADVWYASGIAIKGISAGSSIAPLAMHHFRQMRG